LHIRSHSKHYLPQALYAVGLTALKHQEHK
jgi:hypothetical protein